MGVRRKVHGAACKAKVALAACKEDRTVNQLPATSTSTRRRSTPGRSSCSPEPGRSSPTGPNLPRQAPRPAKRSCTSRSGGSRWSWSG